MSICLCLRSILICLALLALGCQPSTPSGVRSGNGTSGTDTTGHDEESLPRDFAAGVTELDRLHTEIAAAFTANQPENAHDALHTVLELLPQLGEKGAITGDALVAVRDATQVLSESFKTLDDAMHDEKPVEFEPLRQKMADAVMHLKEAAAAMPAGTGH